MKEIYVNMNDGSRTCLLQTGDDVEVERWIVARFEALRRIGAENISCEVHAEGLLEKIEQLCLVALDFRLF